MGLFGNKNETACIHCQIAIPAGSKFCTECGKPQKAEIACPKCGASNPADSKFCHRCKKEIIPEDAPQTKNRSAPPLEGRTWARDEDDIAVRFEDDAIGKQWRKNFVADASSKALMFQNGDLLDTIIGGKLNLSNLDTMLGQFNRSFKTEILLIHNGEFGVEVESPGLTTTMETDEGRVSAPDANVRVKFYFRLVDEGQFYHNTLGARVIYKKFNLMDEIKPDVRTVIKSLLSAYSYDQLETRDSPVQRDIEARFQRQLHTHVRSLGFMLVRVGFFDIHSIMMSRLGRSDSENRRKIFENEQQAQEQEINAESNRLKEQELQEEFRHHKVKVELLDQIRLVHIDSVLSKARSEEELAEEIHRIDKNRLLHDDELAQYQQDLIHHREDRESLRTQLRKTTELLRESELKKLERRIDQEITELKDKDDYERLLRTIKYETTLHEHALNKIKLAALQRLEIKNLEREADLQQQLENAQNDYDIARIRSQIRKIDIDTQMYRREREFALETEEDFHDLEVLERMKGNKSKS